MRVLPLEMDTLTTTISFARSNSRGLPVESAFLGNRLSKTNAAAETSSSNRSPFIAIEASKRKGPVQRMQRQQQQQRPMPRMPKAEDDNPRFVIYIRSKNVPLWYPVNVVSGGTAAKFMVGVTKNPLGKKVYGNSLTNNIGAAVYKDEQKIVTSVVKSYPTLKTAKEFQFGYKLVDEDQPDEALRPVDVTLIPPKEELKPITEKVSEAVGKGLDRVKDSLGL